MLENGLVRRFSVCAGSAGNEPLQRNTGCERKGEERMVGPWAKSAVAALPVRGNTLLRAVLPARAVTASAGLTGRQPRSN
jgi:hypothetical protein